MNPIPAHHNPGPRRRILTLDLLRGFALLVIIVDHLVLFPSLYMFLTGQGRLWVTAAEAFFFISGLMIGLVRGREIERLGRKVVVRKLYARAWRLYLASVVLTVLYSVLAVWLTSHGVTGSKTGLVTSTDALGTIWHTLTLTYVYGWSDFLPYYVIYLLLSPFVLWLLRRGKWAWVVGVSAAGWILPFLVANFPAPAGMRWQIYFFVGTVIGYHLEDIRAWWASKPASRRRLAERATVATGIVMMLVSGAITLLPIWFEESENLLITTMKTIDGNDIYRDLFQDNRTGLLRPLIFLLVFTAFALVVRRYQNQINSALGWLLIPLGRNSLYVYIMQGLVAFTVPFLGLPQNFVVNTLVTTAAIAVVWYLVRREFMFNIIPR